MFYLFKFLVYSVLFSFILKDVNAQKEIDMNEFLDLLISDNQTCILDAREKKDFKLAHFKNAIYVPNSKTLNEVIKNIDFDTHLLIYCTNYSWCLSVSDLCFENEFTKIYYLYKPIENIINYFPRNYYYLSKKYERKLD